MNDELKEQSNYVVFFLAKDIHLDHFRQEIFQLDRIDEYRKSTFWSSKLLIDKNQDNLVKLFLKSIVDSHLHPYRTPYSQVLVQLLETYPDQFEQLKAQLRTVDRRVHFVYEEPNREELINQIRSFYSSETLLDNLELKESSQQYELFVNKIYKFHMIQLAVSQILVYCIFNNKYDLAEYAFTYNQPYDADSIWTNTEIVFTTYEELLYVIYNSGNLIESYLIMVWKDHHGLRTYIDHFFVAIFFYMVKRSRPIPRTFNSLANILRLDAEKVEGFIEYLVRLERKNRHLIMNSIWPYSQMDKEQIKVHSDSFEKLFETIKTSLRASIM